MHINKITALLILIPWALFGRELSPWFDRNIEIQSRFHARYQTYPYLRTAHEKIRKPGYDRFYTGSLALAYDVYAIEIEGTVADTRRQYFCFDNIQLTGRYRLANDLVADPFSLTAGITVIQAFKHSVHDVSSFHPGKLEGEIHLALGKEKTCKEFWHKRWWVAAIFGLADQGWPWLRGKAVWEKNWWDQTQVGIFMNVLWGLGTHSLANLHDFDGYAKIRYRAVDLGFRYNHRFENSSFSLLIEYGYRIYARNFPTHAQNLLFTLHYPFWF